MASNAPTPSPVGEALATLISEIPTLLITVLVVVLVALLLLTGTATVNNPFIDLLTGTIIPFWFLRGAFQWMPKIPLPMPKESSEEEGAPPRPPPPVPPVPPAPPLPPLPATPTDGVEVASTPAAPVPQAGSAPAPQRRAGRPPAAGGSTS